MAPELPHGGSGAFLCSFSAPSLYCSLLSFGLFALSGAACLLSSAPPCSPRECPCRTGSLYVPSWVPSFCPPPDSRLPSVAPGCGAAYSLLDSSLLPVLLATLFCPSSLSTGMPRPGGPPCMSRHGYPPSAFSRFQAPGRDTRPRPVPASLSSPLRARTSVSSFFRGSVRKMLYI